MGLSLGSDVEAWRVNDQLPPDSYLAAPVTPVTRKDSKKGDPQIEVDWRVASGDWKGAEQRDWFTFMESTLGGVAQLLEACAIDRPTQEFDSYEQMRDWVADELDKAPRTVMVVRNEADRYQKKDGTWVDTERPKIQGYRRPDEGDLSSDASGFNGAPKVKDDAPF
jgi:hypothetical protein